MAKGEDADAARARALPLPGPSGPLMTNYRGVIHG